MEEVRERHERDLRKNGERRIRNMMERKGKKEEKIEKDRER